LHVGVDRSEVSTKEIILTTTTMASPIILGMGNPLLDISATVTPAMLEKYGLKANDAILYEKEDLYDELLKDYKVDYIAGGATQNSCRVAQWLLPDKKSVAFFGCVGMDKSCEELEKVSAEAGMVVKYQKSKEHPTGKCAVLITGQDRSLVTKLDAANHFTTAHLEDKDNWALVEAAKVFYSSGFFLTVSPDSMVKVAQHAGLTGKHFAMNLSAPFLCQFFKDPMLKVMAHANIVFGNETEADAFGEAMGYETKDRKEIAKKIAEMPLEGVSPRSRVVVITQGSDPVLVIENGKLTEYHAKVLPKESIVDTNGAGDAFVGGFLAKLAEGKSIQSCVLCGIWAATEIIQQSGCTCPDKTYTE